MDFSSNTEPASEKTSHLIERLEEQAKFLLKNLENGAQGVAAERDRLEKLPPDAQSQLRLTFLRREQEAAQMASMRIEIYHLELRRHAPFCPYCWMLEGRRVKLKPMLETEEALACEVCGSAY